MYCLHSNRIVVRYEGTDRVHDEGTLDSPARLAHVHLQTDLVSPSKRVITKVTLGSPPVSHPQQGGDGWVGATGVCIVEHLAAV